ncbi:MAG: Gfo/Idh/MocA family oxidoreductase [Nitrospinales bacterium]
MGEQIHLALIGAGFWGKNLARTFHGLQVLKAICDPSTDVRQREKGKYPDVETSVSFPDILASPETNAIAIASPAEMHYSMVRDSLLAGKHVFVEKPLALTEEEGRELVDIARKKNRVLFVGHILHYHPAIATLKKMIDAGDLGRLQYIYSNRLNLGKIRREENILWSFAPHDISIILSLTNEDPHEVTAISSTILHPQIADTTLTHMRFPSGVSAHIFVSWLHPFKEQKLVVVGSNQMAVFDDTAPVERKLTLYPHNILWKEGIPIPEKKEGHAIDLSATWQEPLAVECRAFLDAVGGKPCYTDGDEGLRVLRILRRAQASMDGTGAPGNSEDYFVHETGHVEEDCLIGKGTKIWNYSRVLKGSKIGERASIGQNVVIGPYGVIGNNVKIQNNVSVYQGVTLEDNVFCGPSCVFTNVINPRSAISRKHEFQTTRVREGATLGANATILCGVTIGKYAFIGAGAVVTKDVPDYALVYGNPAAQQGWMCKCGHRLNENKHCAECGATLDSASG